MQRHPLLHVDATPLMHAEGAKRVQALLERRTTEAKGWYMHLDLDVAGPEELPGGMTPAPFWPPRHYLLEAVAAAARAVPVRVLGVAVYNPAFDSDGRGARLGIDMAMAVFDSIRDL